MRRIPPRIAAFAAAAVCAVSLLYLGLRLGSSGKQPRERVRDEAKDAPTNLSPRPSDSSRNHEGKMLAESLRRSPDHVPVLLRLAQLASEDRRFEEAKGYLRKALEKEPDNGAALLEMGRALFELGDVQGAIEYTKRVLAKNPADVEALYNMGAIYANLGNSAVSRDYWNRLLAANPEPARASLVRELLRKLPTTTH